MESYTIEKLEVKPYEDKSQSYTILMKKTNEKQIKKLKNEENFITTALSTKNHIDKLKELLQSAKKSIKISTFIFDDEEAAQLLIEASERLIGGVYVLTSDLNEKIRSAFGYSRTQKNKHLKILSELNESPVAVRCVDGLHAKFWIFDRKLGVITSANLTNNSLNNVPEVGIILKNEAEIDYLNFLFNRLWMKYASFEVKAGELSRIEAFKTNKRLNKKNRPEKIAPFIKLEVQKRKYKWNEKSWYEKVHTLMEEANKSIRMATWSMSFRKSNNEEKNLKKIIERKLEEGITTQIIISEREYNKNNRLRAKFDDLKNKFQNFEYFVHPSNHSKFIIIDDDKYFLSTKNFEPPDKYPQSFELGIEIVGNNYLNIVWERLVQETYALKEVHSVEELLKYEASKEGSTIYYKDIEIWIWHQQKPIAKCFYCPNLKEIVDKIKKTRVIKYFETKENKKIIQIYSDFNLILSSDNKLIWFSDENVNLENIKRKHIFNGKIIFKKLTF